MTIRVAVPLNKRLLERLSGHPHVLLEHDTFSDELRFWQGDWMRQVRIGDSSQQLRGLVEMMDNNPMVCADAMSVPSPAATLALVALGPAAKAGILLDSPTVISNLDCDSAELSDWLETAGPVSDVVTSPEEIELDGVGFMTAVAPVKIEAEPGEIDDLYEECFGRSFFVRRDESSDWDPRLVRGMPFAVYRLSLAAEAGSGLLSVRAMADLNGKLGADQVVHAMNVMAGFEESLGLEA